LVVKKEKLKHMLAFEYYFLLGGLGSKRSKKETMKKLDIARGSKFYKGMSAISGRRSLLRVARKFNVSRTAANNWHKAFNWEERARERDNEINREVIMRGSQS
jgi:hypothetical protein